MHRTARLAHGDADRLFHGFGYLALFQPERCFGDRRKQRMVVDPHLDAPAELVGVQVAGDGDQRRAVEPGVADACGQVGSAGPERRNAQAGLSGHPAGHIGGEASGALVGGQHKVDAALPHRLHQRQHVSARDAEAAVDAGGFQRGDDEIGIVHGGHAPWLCREPCITWLLRNAQGALRKYQADCCALSHKGRGHNIWPRLR
ncbi:MAG: hypothetical protein NTV56_23630 [Alphaproteobacteria bacterium]|nr:hypothetical protein [Alphaproteobacteria bacterium]